jgi:hypothetical protein
VIIAATRSVTSIGVLFIDESPALVQEGWS